MREPDDKGELQVEDARERARSNPPLEVILESAHEAFVSIDDAGRIRAWNREAERTFGWAKETVVGERIRDVLIPPQHRAAHDEGLRRFLETGVGPLLNKRIEITALHRSGREIPVELTISPIEDGGRWSFHAFLHDISERRRASELQARLATLVEHSADAIISRAADGAITSWNPAAERLYGYSAEEMRGRTAGPLLAADPKLDDEHISRALRGEAIQGLETVHLAKDGRRIDVSLTISPIYDDAGRIHELAMIARDISASKHAQRALVQAYEELRHASELKSQLVAVASHEIRTPLTSISGFAATLLARWDRLAAQERLEFIGLIDSQAQRLRHLVDNVLLLSRLEAGMATNAPVPVDLGDVAVHVVAELRLGEEAAIAKLGAPIARGEPAHVHQILLNFVANAIAYGAPPFTITVEEEAETVTARVTDSGDGVPEPFLPHLFEAYTRAERHDDAKQGSGLGLAIARGMAEAAAGEVWYEPNQPCGACFCLRLPKGDREAPPAAPAQAAPEPA